jgi:hypothetical protein
MKKILFTAIVLVGFSQFSKAQEIGIRFGDAVGGNYAIDGVISLAGFSRIHADVSFGWNRCSMGFLCSANCPRL